MKRTTLRALLTITVALALAHMPAAGRAAPPAGTTTLVYDFSRSGLSLAEMTDTLHVRAHEYELSSSAQAIGIAALLARGQTLKRESRGAIGPGGLTPKTFSEERGANYRLTAEFDWDKRQIVLIDAKGERLQESLPERTQDRLSMPYQLAFAPGSPPAELTIHVADGRRLSAYAFRLVGTETVTTGLGDIKALHYTKVLAGSDTAFDFWLGIDQHLLPVRVSYADKDGARYEQSLRRLNVARF